MDVYRVHNRKYEPLDGSGAAVVGGRWNPVGSLMVYASVAYEGALLEQLVHAGTGRLPGNRVASVLHIPDDVPVLEFDPSDLPDWRREAESQRFGREWLDLAEAVALRVPSIVAQPWGRNVILNPLHPDFPRVTIVETSEVVWDPRLAVRVA